MLTRDNWYQENQEKGASSTNTFDTGGWKKGSKKAGKEKPSKIKPTTVLFVPSTKGGLLTKMLRQNEEEMVRITQFKTKVQEAGWIKTLTFCNYAPGGNFMKKSLFTEGEACSKCEDGMTCDDGLCVE